VLLPRRARTDLELRREALDEWAAFTLRGAEDVDFELFKTIALQLAELYAPKLNEAAWVMWLTRLRRKSAGALVLWLPHMKRMAGNPDANRQLAHLRLLDAKSTPINDQVGWIYGGGPGESQTDHHALQEHLQNQITRKRHVTKQRSTHRLGTASSTASLNSLNDGEAGLFRVDFNNTNSYSNVPSQGYKSLAIPPLADKVFRSHDDTRQPKAEPSLRRLSPWSVQK